MNGLLRIACSGGWVIRGITMGVSALALSACSALSPTATPATAFYVLDGAQKSVVVSAERRAVALSKHTMLISPPHAAAGFDSTRIIYLREPHRLDYYALSQWVDPPARMLGPLLVAAIEKTGAFQAVVLMPGAASGEVRLETVIIRLQHEFQTHPSQVRLTLRATLLDDRTRKVLAWQAFDAVEPASSEDAYGGVLAANRAVQTVMDEVALFVAAKAGAAKTVPAIP